ncbi:MAG: methylenetetrahydrofolate reductase C-terminal domain-containing protein [Candidatus Omnitrophica bacterium]|nr:methylenetetrahydrofolate reductase C-terminal domain-containing protein [Candidatus Omnitrophota bacterium]MDD5351587.1 methylenetetrahydrofolate reductase C-terminal domain-containing protein [Candidatus Omnitrophota bacterium]MDD5551022.1 methylenetetrahydrofolate reductase C-terminal domain-containing protein [Candidatus Omnitrophota bacterium]
MIFTKQKDFNFILNLLKGKSKVFLVGCGECATTCKTGGEEEILEMKKKLEEAGKSVTGWVVPESACISSQVKTAMAKNRQALSQAEAVLVFSCGSGTQSFKENDRMNLDVYSGNDTLFAASVDSQGNFTEVCSACGDCILELTEGICPVTRCAKGILNGPCGGQKDGKCEVDRTKDCAWILIYKAKTQKNKTGDLKSVIKTRDYKKSLKPHIAPAKN